MEKSYGYLQIVKKFYIQVRAGQNTDFVTFSCILPDSFMPKLYGYMHISYACTHANRPL